MVNLWNIATAMSDRMNWMAERNFLRRSSRVVLKSWRHGVDQCCYLLKTGLEALACTCMVLEKFEVRHPTYDVTMSATDRGEDTAGVKRFFLYPIVLRFRFLRKNRISARERQIQDEDPAPLSLCRKYISRRGDSASAKEFFQTNFDSEGRAE